MPKHDFLFTAVVQSLENDNYLAEALFFPEISRFRTNSDAPKDDLRANLSRIVEEDLPPIELHRRHSVGEPVVSEVAIELEPPSRSVAWRRPVALRFHVVRWAHGDNAHLAFIPALGIEIIASNAEELEAQIPRHIHTHLLRTKAAASLGPLVWLQRCRSLEIERLSFTASIHTPKQIAMQAARRGDDETKKSVLQQATTDLTSIKLPEAYELDDLVARIAEAFTGRAPKSVLLVGPSGVGKTAAVHELVLRRSAFNLSRTPFRSTSGARLVAGMSGFGMWQERCQKLWREASKEKTILHLGNLIELMEVGKSEGNSQGIAGFLHPYIARGDLLVIAECLPEQIQVVERADPHLLEAFHRINVEEPSIEKGRAILLNFAVAAGEKHKPAIEMEGIERIDQLHRRYTTYSAYPGRPLRFLKNLLKDREGDKPLTASDVTAAFSRETGLPLFLLEESMRLDLAEARHWFTERVIGQAEAVDLVIDLLATVKAGLVRPRKPIASLLFIGPTGTGKSEMAKSLAEFLFQDRNRMVRFDMSEYADPLAVQRLIGGVTGSEGLLTAKVREQPFAVVLLDEFEKAHPQFFDLLLQVLGEGRLTDAAGRVADFCNAVVIMTSNLGAESFQRGVRGFSTGTAADNGGGKRAAQHFLKEVRGFVRPELFNRIDRVVPFAPLAAETVHRIAERELEKLIRRDGVMYRNVRLNIAGEVARYLARKGYDPRYGARPLKRAIERELLAPLSEDLNQYKADEALAADVMICEDRLSVRTRPLTDESGRRVKAVAADATLIELTKRAAGLRRKSQKLERSPAALELGNQIFRLERLERRLVLLKWKREGDYESLARLPKLRRVAQAMKDFAERIFALETDALLALYGKASFDQQALTAALSSAAGEWQRLLLELYSLRFSNPDAVTLTIFSESAEHLFTLARAYFAHAVAGGATVEVVHFTIRRPSREKSEEADEPEAAKKVKQKAKEPEAGAEAESEKVLELDRKKIEKPAKFFGKPAPGGIGIALVLSGPFVHPLFIAERGLHLFTAGKKEYKCLVQASEGTLDEYRPPAGIARRGVISGLAANQELRRSWNADQFIVEDKALGKRFAWPAGAIDETLAEVIEECLMKEVNSLIG
ncbi:MAG TPA: AAA family ATPase [Blastocatellia bacterium]|nr:AAA family ATPase [Blastocatellia bacterium]